MLQQKVMEPIIIIKISAISDLPLLPMKLASTVQHQNTLEQLQQRNQYEIDAADLQSKLWQDGTNATVKIKWSRKRGGADIEINPGTEKMA